MKSSIPEPKFVISRCPGIDEHGTEYNGLTVDARISRYVSNGYLFLDAPEHLFILRDAVDAAIAELKLSRPENETHSENEIH